MNEAELKEASPSEILYEYCEQKRMWHWEGDSGIEKLNQLVKDMGYKGHGCRYGSPLESFLSDNASAMQAIKDFIVDTISEEQAEGLADELELDDDEEDEESVVVDTESENNSK